MSFPVGREVGTFDDRNSSSCLLWGCGGCLCSLWTSPTDGVSLKMIEDLKAMIDNISQEVALLKEKQALQTGKGLLEEGMAFA